jgi:hypothetical protein
VLAAEKEQESIMHCESKNAFYQDFILSCDNKISVDIFAILEFFCPYISNTQIIQPACTMDNLSFNLIDNIFNNYDAQPNITENEWRKTYYLTWFH